MTGAGLSTPSGIPDFSLADQFLSSANGFKMKKWLPFQFLILAQDLYPGVHYKPNSGHYFMHLLHMKNKLQKLYTQNIDGLERLAGVPENKLVESHGTLVTATCILCGEKHDAAEVKEKIVSGKTPIICQINGCEGKVKPDIVFFGEHLPQNFWDYEVDVQYTDALLVVGTSLEVHPFANIADAVSSNIPRILINREVVGSFGERSNDLMLTGDLICTMEELAQSLDWTKDLSSLMESSS